MEVQLLGHPACSPDLAPWDFSLFPYVKLRMEGWRFSYLSSHNNPRELDWMLMSFTKVAAVIPQLSTMTNLKKTQFLFITRNSKSMKLSTF